MLPKVQIQLVQMPVQIPIQLMIELVGSVAVRLFALVEVFELAVLTEMRIFAQVVAAALVILMGLSDTVLQMK